MTEIEETTEAGEMSGEKTTGNEETGEIETETAAGTAVTEGIMIVTETTTNKAIVNVTII